MYMRFVAVFVAVLFLLTSPGVVFSCSAGYHCPTGRTLTDGGARTCNEDTCVTGSQVPVTVTCGGSNCTWQDPGGNHGKCSDEPPPYCQRVWAGTGCCTADDDGDGGDDPSCAVSIAGSPTVEAGESVTYTVDSTVKDGTISTLSLSAPGFNPVSHSESGTDSFSYVFEAPSTLDPVTLTATGKMKGDTINCTGDTMVVTVTQPEVDVTVNAYEATDMYDCTGTNPVALSEVRLWDDPGDLPKTSAPREFTDFRFTRSREDYS